MRNEHSHMHVWRMPVFAHLSVCGPVVRAQEPREAQATAHSATATFAGKKTYTLIQKM